MNALRAAFAYFTVLPVGRAAAPEADALAWLPLVGLAVGGLAGGAGYATALVAPHALAVAVAFGASVLLTGAIHLDGFLDCCDALGAAVPVARRLEILKDPNHGTFALAGFAVLGVLWLAALWALPVQHWPWALAFAGGTARAAAVQNAYLFPYGRSGGSIRAFERRPNVLIVAGGVLLCLALAAYRPALAAGIPIASLLSLGFARFAAGRLGGALAGDVYGAAIVLVEVALVVYAALLR